MFYFFFLFFSFSSFSVELIHDYDQIESLDKKIAHLDSLGSAITPYFYDGSVPSRVFKSYDGKCRAVFIYSSSVFIKKRSCSKTINYKLSNYNEFKHISPKDIVTEKSYSLKKDQFLGSYYGVPYKYNLRDLYDVKLDTFSFKYIFNNELRIKSGSFEIIQEVNFSVNKFHFYPKNTETVRHVINVRSGDLLFTNSKGEYILYKRYQPKPLNFRSLVPNLEYLNYLDSVEHNLFNATAGDSYCFVDDVVMSSPFGCKTIAKGNEKIKAYSYRSFNLIHINTNSGSIRHY